jgi:hypothetical protein
MNLLRRRTFPAPWPWRARWARSLIVAGLLGLVSGGSGCVDSSEGPPRLPVSGKVSLDGQPLESGAITFIPDADGPATAAKIATGEFQVPQAEGPSPGPYKVEIVSVRPTGRQIASPDDPSSRIEESRNRIPTRYNARTQLRVEVRPGVENAFQFDLSSKEERPGTERRRRR